MPSRKKTAPRAGAEHGTLYVAREAAEGAGRHLDFSVLP